MKYTQWKQAPPCAPQAVKAMAAQGISPLAAAVLCVRGLDTPEKAWAFLTADKSQLNDPFLLRDMDRAVARITDALERGETIAVYGDYDVDGITATCLLTRYLTARGGRVLPYIPDRMEEGYGLNHEAISALKEAGVSLIVTVDCGITAVAEACHAARLGVDLIITDHHECQQTLPEAVAVINPHRKDCAYPFPFLAGVGVALKLVLALGGRDQEEGLLEEYADLAAVGTIADVMRLEGENRAIVQMGLALLNRAPRPGLGALLGQAGGQGKPVDSTAVSFMLAPRLNAAGRMGCASLAVRLLLTQDPQQADDLAKQLCDLNRERQAVESEIFTACTQMVEGDFPAGCQALVLAREGWHQGVVGIVASRLAERYHCPAFMICLQEGSGKGSCRSYGGVNLFQALEYCSDLLEGFGGHALAAGFTIREENIPAFRAKLEQWMLECTGGAQLDAVLELDAEVDDCTLLSRQNVEGLSLLEPYGAANPRPVFALLGAAVTSVSEVGGGRHLKLKVSRDGVLFDAIFFSVNLAQCRLKAGDSIDVAFFPQINEFRGNWSVQLQIVDLRPALTHAQAEEQLVERLLRGGDLSSSQASCLLPSRGEFAGLWRYLKSHARENELEETPCQLSQRVAHAYGLPEGAGRTVLCLEALHQAGLIELERGCDRLRVQLREPAEKVDLEGTPIMRRLRAMLCE